MTTSLSAQPIEKKNSSWLLFIILLAIFVVPSSISGTAIALPMIGIDLNASITSLQWVVNAFNLAFACFTLTWGALSDKIGHKRCFLLGAFIYAIASVGSSLSNTPLLLDLMRGMAGIGAAAVFSCGISILSIQYAGAARLRAFALFGTVAGLGVSFGPTISGLLIENLNWQSIFWFHAVSLFIVIIASPLIPTDKKNTSLKTPFDLLGALLFIAWLLSLMTAIVQAPVWGWHDAKIITLLILSCFILFIFIKLERRQALPLLDLGLLKNSNFLGMSLVTVAASLGFVTLLTYLPTYFSVVLNLTSSQAGFSMILLTAPMLVCPILAGKLSTKGFNPTKIIYISLLFLILGVVSLAIISRPSMSVFLLAPSLLMIGIGMGLSAGLIDGLALQFIPEEKTGMAAGIVNTFRLGSEAIAVALYAAFLSTTLNLQLKEAVLPFASTQNVATQWISKVASGDIKTPIEAVNSSKTADLTSILEYGYNASFQYTLMAIGALLILLTFTIYKLLNSRKV